MPSSGVPAKAGASVTTRAVSQRKGAIDRDISEVTCSAMELDVDLVVLGHERHHGSGNAFRSSVSEAIIHQHPSYSILLARPPQVDR